MNVKKNIHEQAATDQSYNAKYTIQWTFTIQKVDSKNITTDRPMVLL